MPRRRPASRGEGPRRSGTSDPVAARRIAGRLPHGRDTGRGGVRRVGASRPRRRVGRRGGGGAWRRPRRRSTPCPRRASGTLSTRWSPSRRRRAPRRGLAGARVLHGRDAGSSVAYALTSRLSCPVVVVHGEGSLTPARSPRRRGGRRVGGGHRRTRHRRRRRLPWGAPLTAPGTWPPSTPGSTPYTAPRAAPGAHLVDDSERAADAVAHEAADRARARHPGLAVGTDVEAASPAQALVHKSHGAGLVVVGARGRGRLSGLLLGSVRNATIHRASCPVAVVRADQGWLAAVHPAPASVSVAVGATRTGHGPAGRRPGSPLGQPGPPTLVRNP